MSHKWGLEAQLVAVQSAFVHPQDRCRTESKWGRGLPSGDVPHEGATPCINLPYRSTSIGFVMYGSFRRLAVPLCLDPQPPRAEIADSLRCLVDIP